MKNRASTIEGLLQNYKIIDEVINAAENSEGSAKKENEKYLESIEGKMNQLTNAVQEFWHVLLDTGAVGKVIDFLTNFVNLATDVVEKIGIAPTILGSIGISIGSIINLLNLYDHRRGIFGLLKDYANDSDIIKNLDLTSASLRKLTNVWSSLGEVVKLTGKAMSKWFLALPATAKGVIVAVGAVTALATAIYKIYDATHISDKEAVEISEKAKNSIEEINRAFNEGKKVVNSYFEEYKKLSKGVDISTNTNLSLSEDEYQKYLNICNEIAEAYPQLKKGTDENGNAILDLGDSSQEAANKLQSFIEKQEDLKNIEISNHLNELFSGVGVQISQAKERLIEFDNKAQELEKRIVYLKKILSDGFQFDEVGNLIITPEFEENKDAMALAFENFYNELPEQRQVDLEPLLLDAKYKRDFSKFNNIIMTGSEYDGLYRNASVIFNKDLAQASSEYIQNRSSAAQEENFIKYTWQDSLNYLNDSMTTMDAYKGLSDGTQTIASALVKSLDSSLSTEFKNSNPTEFILRNVLLPLLELPAEKQAEIDQAYNELLTLNLKDLSFYNQKEIQELINQIAVIIGEDPIELRLALGFNIDESFEKSYHNSIEKTLNKFGELSLTESENLFSELGIDSQDEIAKWNEIILKVGTLTDAVKEYKDLVNTATPEQMISQINGLSSGFEHLDKIMESIKDEDPFDYSLLADDAMAEFKELGGDAYTEFYETISKYPNDLEKCQDAFNNLVTEWVDGKAALEGLSKETAQLTIDMLKNMGVTNAAEVVYSRLAIQRAEVETQTRDMSKMTKEEIDRLAEENGVLEEGKDAWYAYFAQKMLDEVYNGKGSIEQLKNVIEALGIATDTWNNYWAAVRGEGAFKINESDYKNGGKRVLISEGTEEVYDNYTLNEAQSERDLLIPDLKKAAEKSALVQIDKILKESTSTEFTGPNSTKDTGSDTEEKMDFIERKIEKVRESYSKLKEEADDSNNTYANQLNYLNSAIDKQEELIDLQRLGEGVYKTQWEIDSAGLSEEQKNLIMNGDFKIETYKGADADQMKKADESWKTYDEWVKARKEEEKSYDENLRLRYSKQKEWDEQEIDRLIEKSEIEQTSYSDAISYLNEAKKKSQELENEMRGYAEQAKTAWDNAKANISDPNDIAKIMNGTLNLEDYKDDPEYQATLKVGMEAYEDYQDSEVALNDAIKKNAETAKKAFEKAIEVVDAQQDLVNSNISSTEKTIEVINALGGNVTADTYRDLISDNEDLVKLYEDEIKLIEARIDEVEPESAEYYQLKARLNECNDALNDCTIKTQEWIEAIKKLPINRLQTFITNLGYIKQTLKNFTDEQNALGFSPTIEQHEESIKLNNIENEKLLEQKQHWIDLAKTYEYGSEKYEECMSNISNIDTQISQNIQENIEHAKQILMKPLEQLKNAKDALDRAESILDSRISYDEERGIRPSREQYALKKQTSMTRYNLAQEEVEAQKKLMNTFEEGSADWLEAKANHDAALATSNNELVKMYQYSRQEVQDSLDAIDEAYEKITDLGDAIQDLNDIKESKGQDLTVEDYQRVINANFTALDSLQRMRNEFVKQLDGLEEGSEMYKTIQDKIKNCDKEMARLIKDIHAFNNALLQMPLDQIDKLNDKLSKISSPIQDKMGDFDSAMSAVNYVIDEEIEKINDIIEATNEEYDAKIEPLNDELELLRKTNEERDIQLALEKAQYDLERARNQKTNMVIRDGKIVYEADQEALRAANESMADAQYNKAVHDLEVQIENLEKERDELIEGYEEQIENLNDIKDLWSEIVESIEAAANIEIATSIFGEGWIDKVLSGDDADLRELFKNGYGDLFKQDKEIEKQQESNDRVKEAIGLITDAYNRGDITLEQANSYLDKLAENSKDGYTADEYLKDQLEFKGVDFGAITNATNEQIGEIINGTKDNLKIVEENKGKTDEAEKTLEENIGDLATAVSTLDGEVSKLSGAIDGFKTTLDEINEKMPSWEEVEDSLGLDNITFDSDTIDKSISAFNANMAEIDKNTLKWSELNIWLDKEIDALEDNHKELEEKQNSKKDNKKPTSSSGGSGSGSSKNDNANDDDDDGIYISAGGNSYHESTGSAAEIIGEYGSDAEKNSYSKMRYDQIEKKAKTEGDAWYKAAKKALDEELENAGLPTYHTGIAKGPVGYKPLSEDKLWSFAQKVALNPLKADEVFAILQKGEGVFQPEQIANVMRNNQLIGRLSAEEDSLGAINTVNKGTVVDFSIGEIHLHEVQDVDGFAKALDQTFAIKMGQNFSKQFK